MSVVLFQADDRPEPNVCHLMKTRVLLNYDCVSSDEKDLFAEVFG